MRLPADIVKHRADFRVHVGMSIEKLAESCKVVGMPAHVSGNERRLRISCEQIVPLLHQLVEARILILRIPSPWKQRELEPPLVRQIYLVAKEFLRVTGVNENWNSKTRAFLPDGIEVWIVDSET